MVAYWPLDMHIGVCMLLIGAGEERLWGLAPNRLNGRNVLIASVSEMSLTHTPLKLMTFYLF